MTCDYRSNPSCAPQRPYPSQKTPIVHSPHQPTPPVYRTLPIYPIQPNAHCCPFHWLTSSLSMLAYRSKLCIRYHRTQAARFNRAARSVKRRWHSYSKRLPLLYAVSAGDQESWWRRERDTLTLRYLLVGGFSNEPYSRYLFGRFRSDARRPRWYAKPSVGKRLL